MPAVPADVDIDGPWLWDAEAETVFSTRTSVRDVDDALHGHDRPRVQPDVRTAAPDADGARRASPTPTRVDPELSDDAQAVLDEVIAGATTDFDQRRRAADLLPRHRASSYDEDDRRAADRRARRARPPSCETSRGFCEQFASAMAALVRGAGIPARVAVGFTHRRRATATATTRVTTGEAHAWPEVWFQGAGWVRFEPTPRVGRRRRRRPRLQRRAAESRTTPTPTAAPSAAPAAPQPARAPRPARSTAARDGRRDRRARAASLDEGLSPWWLLAARRAWRCSASRRCSAAVRRRRRWRSPDALAAWASVADDAVDVGHRWRPADSPRAAAAHLLGVRHLPDDAAEALRRLGGRRRAGPLRPDRSPGRRRRRCAPTPRRSAPRCSPAPRRRERWLARLLPGVDAARRRARALGTAVADVLDRFDVAGLAPSARGCATRGPGRRGPG